MIEGMFPRDNVIIFLKNHPLFCQGDQETTSPVFLTKIKLTLLLLVYTEVFGEELRETREGFGSAASYTGATEVVDAKLQKDPFGFWAAEGGGRPPSPP